MVHKIINQYTTSMEESKGINIDNALVPSF